MRVLLVTEPSGGGSGRHVIDLAKRLSERGHEVCLVYSPVRAEARFEAEAAALGLWQLQRLDMARAVGVGDLKSALRLRDLVRQHGPFDIVHAHSSKAGALIRVVAPASSGRVYTPHALRTMDPNLGKVGQLVYGGIEWLLAQFLSDAVIAVAPEEARHARDLGFPEDRLHTVVNGVDASPVVDRTTVRADLGLDRDAVAIGFVGRLCDQKDPLRFVEALRIAHARDPRFRGVMLGDGELAEATRAAAGEAISVLSNRNARDYLPAFDAFAMTSRYEAMPYVLLEALQAALPVVATAVGGTSATVAPGENGLVVPVDASAETFADALLTLAPSAERARMADRSRELARQFSLEAMVDATEAVYRAAITNRLHGRAGRSPSLLHT